MKRISTAFTILWSIIFAILIAFLLYFGIHYEAQDVEGYLASSKEITITETDSYYFFDSKNDDKALIFYQGAKVDEKAYAPLMSRLASEGIDCFLIKMPYEFAIFNINAADEIINSYSYEKWYLAGHSLGGAMSESYIAKHQDKFDGLFLLAAYGTEDISKSDITVRAIYGDKDGVMSKDKLEECKKNMPSDYAEIVIKGANHAGFASYGAQKGDNEASISAIEQIEFTAIAIISSME